jgi:predicted SnoaL-like aldol condensation-catalyzing enzyme
VPAASKKLVTEFIEVVLNGGDPSRAGEFLAPTFLDHHPWPGHAGTREGFASGLAALRTSFPDTRFEIDRIDFEAGIVRVLVTRRATHPEGRRVEMRVLELMRVDGGRIVERWGLLDEDANGKELPPNAVVADRRLFVF